MIGPASVALAVVIGWLAVRLISPAPGFAPRWAAWLLELALGAGAGVAISSILFFLLLVLGAPNRGTVLASEVALIAALVLAQRWRPKPSAATAHPAHTEFRWTRLLTAALALGLVLVVATQVDTVRKSPYGNWEAFSTWNLKAKFLLAPGVDWKLAASPLLERAHADYPLLLPAFVARCWRLGGDITSPAAPLTVSFLLSAAVIALLAALLALVRGAPAALLACFVLLAASSYIEQIPWQYADIPLSFYILATFSFVLLDDGRAGPVIAAGVFSSFAALTKNEGAAFALISFLCDGAVTWKASGRNESLRRAAGWIAGALPGLLLLGYFRFALAPNSSLRAQELLDFSRYGEALTEIVTGALQLGNGFTHPLLLYGILAVALRFDLFRQRAFFVFGAVTLSAMLLSYFALHVVSPAVPLWLEGASPNRLYTSLWPSIVLLMFLVLGRLRDPVAAETHRAKKIAQHGRKK